MNYHSDSSSAAPYINRKGCPPVSLYFYNTDTTRQPYKLSCMFCKRTIATDVTGDIDKMIDGPMPADDHGLAINIQCKLCGQIYRVLGSPRAVQAEIEQR